MPKIKFVKEKKEIEVPQGTNLRLAMIQNGIPVYRGIYKKSYANCGGKGLCQTCTVFVKDGDENTGHQKGFWSIPSRIRGALAAFYLIGHEVEAKLSCQTTVEGDMVVESTPEFNWYGDEIKYTTRPVE